MILPKNKLGRALRKARLSRGARQQDVSACAGLSACYYSHLETGRQRGPLETVIRVCKCLGISEKKAIALWRASDPDAKARAA